MNFNEKQITAEIQQIAADLLTDKRVDKIIGYGLDDFSAEVTPVFITQSKDSKQLLFNRDCKQMLAKYLLNYPETNVAIVAKPCDTRAIASYLAENKLKRDNLTIIGIQGCPGVENNSACSECEIRNPIVADFTVGEILSEEEIAEMIKLADKQNLDDLSPKERLNYFQEEFSRCIRCYACREACHVCYCPECFTESNQPNWLGKSINLADNFTYHLMRSMHMAGRCIDCGACEMACPEGINVRALVAKLNRSAREIYGYKAGVDPDQKTLLTDYKVNDPQPGFIEGVE